MAKVGLESLKTVGYGFLVQTLGIVVCSMGVEAVLIKEKSIISANNVVFVLYDSNKLELICKHKGSRKVLWLKQRYFMTFAARL